MAVTGFYLDEDLSPEIARIGRRFGLDVESCHEVSNQRLTDPEQLAYATAHGRCLVTANGRDFEALTNHLYLTGQPHAGVAAVPGTWRQNDFMRIAQALVRLAEDYAETPTDYLFVFLR